MPLIHQFVCFLLPYSQHGKILCGQNLCGSDQGQIHSSHKSSRKIFLNPGKHAVGLSHFQSAFQLLFQLNILTCLFRCEGQLSAIQVDIGLCQVHVCFYFRQVHRHLILSASLWRKRKCNMTVDGCRIAFKQPNCGAA